MKNKMKFKIGEFSKLCQVTVKTLRHYEEIGLMIPVEVDEWTGYRYYDISQLRCMSLASKDDRRVRETARVVDVLCTSSI